MLDASAMWAANAATVTPSTDTRDGRGHLTPANLNHMFHRSIEADTTFAVLRAIFADEVRFAVHPPLLAGAHFADEGAANHTRLVPPAKPAVHLFAWGRSSARPAGAPARYPARQTLEASQAIARLHGIDPGAALRACASASRSRSKRLLPADLANPALAREGMAALDELTRILRLGSIYDFQRAAPRSSSPGEQR